MRWIMMVFTKGSRFLSWTPSLVFLASGGIILIFIPTRWSTLYTCIWKPIGICDVWFSEKAYTRKVHHCYPWPQLSCNREKLCSNHNTKTILLNYCNFLNSWTCCTTNPWTKSRIHVRLLWKPNYYVLRVYALKSLIHKDVKYKHIVQTEFQTWYCEYSTRH